MNHSLKTPRTHYLALIIMLSYMYAEDEQQPPTFSSMQPEWATRILGEGSNAILAR